MTRRCACGRPVPESSSCGCHCAECDDPPPYLGTTADSTDYDGTPAAEEWTA